jgi:AmiR/NasT family two-component response regulator
MGEIAAIGLIQERATRERTLLTEQPQAALTSRVVIEQAKGMLAEHLRMSVDEAFQLIRTHARDRNLKLSQVASDGANLKVPSAALITSPGQKS